MTKTAPPGDLVAEPSAGPGPVAAALAAFRDRGSPWLAHSFFQEGAADAVAQKIDARVAAGARILPDPSAIFRALTLTPLPAVKAVSLGQDPSPTPGDANGLALSDVGGRRLPASLKVILAELAPEGGKPDFSTGDLTPWAERGVLLLNSALTVEAGKAGAHLRFGWSQLTDEAVAAVSAREEPAVFLLWGAQARAREALIDASRHGIVASGHPSPLNRARDFPGSRPFARANAWLEGHGRTPIDWRLT